MSDTVRMPAKPQPIFPDISQIPQELRDLPRWCAFDFVLDPNGNGGKGKVKKPPCSAITGERDGWTASGVTAAEALAGAKRLNKSGIGFIFNGSDFFGVDWDDCADADGNIHPAVQDWRKWFPTYQEFSPSHEGLHFICRGSLARALAGTPLPNAPGVKVEAYSTGRFFCWTSWRVDDAAGKVEDCSTGVTKLLAHLRVQEPSASTSAPENAKSVSPGWVRQQYEDARDKLRKNPVRSGNGNATLNNTAVIASRVCASHVFDKTEEQFKKELFDVVTKEWEKPCDEAQALGTINSGWKFGADQGPYKLRQYVVAVASAQYCAETPKETPYIVNGMIYHGTANQLMGPIKEGKTTLLFAMIRNILSGSDFIGQETKPTNILYVTEQPRYSFQSQLARSGLDRNHLLERCTAGLYVLDLGHLWSLDWEGRVDTIRENAYKLDSGLVIVDTFPRIALVEEIQNAGEMNQRFELIAPLVVADGRTLLMGWHERKAGGSISEAAAGTAASGGAVDMLLRLRRAPGSKLNDRTRQLELCGRLPVAFEESVAIVLNNEMSNYKCLGTKQAAARKNTEQRILSLLPLEPPGLTEAEINKRLTAEAEEEGFKSTSVSTVSRALEKLVESGLVICTGQGGQGRGKSADQYRYHAAPPAF
jgi:hypothetical protein